jgi:2-iminobutanoate/2-iminopropanoate deaminase
LVKPITIDGSAAPQGPFSPASLASGTQFLEISGQIGQDEHGNPLTPRDAGVQARRALAQIGALLQAAGAAPEDVVKVTVFLTDMSDRAAVAQARSEFFGTHRPAATLVEVSALITPDYVVEIEATAVF